MTVQKKILDLTGSQYLVQKVKSAINDVDSSLSTHVADTDIHVTTADKTKWNNGVSQSYVLRYSSSSVTDNSTIAYSTLDNTDNIKASDKIIDSDGKIFSIVSVDTTNQTVTVGSALIDLAKDNDVVHTSGHEAISGDKVFNNRLIKNIDVVLGTAPSTGKFSNIEIADNSKSSLLQIMCGVYDTGQTYARFFIQNKMADDGTGLSPTGTMRACGFNINLPASSTSEGQGSITPRANKTTDFGLANYQWKNVWCEKLYLNGTELAPSAFVTTDTTQTITGAKTFSFSPVIYNADSTTNTANLYLRNSKVTKGSSDTGNQAIFFTDKNNAILSRLFTDNISNGTTSINFRTSTLDSDNNDVSAEIYLFVSKNGTKVLQASVDNDISLGRTSNRWKDTNTCLINGLTPSSLSLPATRDNAIDISSYFTNFNNGDSNQYTPTVNGWVYLETSNCNAIHCFCTTTGNLTHYGNTVARTNDGMAYVLFPVLANMVFKHTWYTNSTIILNRAWFIPCQGNV